MVARVSSEVPQIQTVKPVRPVESQDRVSGDGTFTSQPDTVETATYPNRPATSWNNASGHAMYQKVQALFDGEFSSQNTSPDVMQDQDIGRHIDNYA